MIQRLLKNEIQMQQITYLWQYFCNLYGYTRSAGTRPASTGMEKMIFEMTSLGACLRFITIVHNRSPADRPSIRRNRQSWSGSTTCCETERQSLEQQRPRLAFINERLCDGSDGTLVVYGQPQHQTSSSVGGAVRSACWARPRNPMTESMIQETAETV
jgi:hypothetical protein